MHASNVDLQGSTVLCFPLQMVSAIWTGNVFHAVVVIGPGRPSFAARVCFHEVSEAKSVEACSEELRELMRLQSLGSPLVKLSCGCPPLCLLKAHGAAPGDPLGGSPSFPAWPGMEPDASCTSGDEDQLAAASN